MAFSNGHGPDLAGYPKSYIEAVALWEKIRPWRGESSTDWRPLETSRKRGVRHFRMDGQGNVRFRLYNTDVVIWHPDGSFTVEGYDSQMTSTFGNCFLPGNVSLAKDLVEWTPEGGEHRWGVWNGVENTYTRLKRDTLVARCYHPVHFIEGDAGWAPELSTIRSPFEVLEIDRAEARKISKALKLSSLTWDFVRAAYDVGGVEHQGVDIKACLEALESGDLTTAAQYLPLCSDSGGGWHSEPGENCVMVIENWSRNYWLSPTSIQRLRIAAYRRDGAVTTHWPHIMLADDLPKTLARNKMIERD